jgi:hypothetical protein
VADALTENLKTANLFSSLGTSLFGSSTTRTTSGGSQTDQTMFSQEGINAMLRQLMESEQSGLAKVASGARIPGMYNTTTQQLMVNDLLARTSGEVATRTAPRVTTRQPTTETSETPGMLSSKGGTLGMLGAGALVLSSEDARKKLGIDGIFNDIGSVFGGSSSTGTSVGVATDVANWGGFTSAMAPMATSVGTATDVANFAVEGAAAGGLFDGVSSALATPLWEGGFSAGQALPYLPAVGQLISGDVGGAAITGGLTYVGTAIGGPVGGFIGSTIGSLLGGGCFITTAVCLSGNKPDDCYELQTLRKFRDSWLVEWHPEDVKQYYAEAPMIVSKISAREDAARIFNSFRSRLYPACYCSN